MNSSAAGGAELVSVVVPTRNSSRTLGSCLESVRGQSYAQIQLIVVDNGSTDNSVAIATSYADIVDKFGPERSAQRNQGSRLAGGQYLLFIDSDMRLDADVVSSCICAIHQNTAGAVIIPEITEGQGFWARCRALERSCYVGDNLIEAARFFDRTAFAEAGGFDEALTGQEDWDLSRRVAHGRTLPRIEPLIHHDEGNLRLLDHLAKKAYYAATFPAYWHKHGGSALRQANTLFRGSYLKNWRRLVTHPVLASGMFLMKLLELSVGAGVLAKEAYRTKGRARAARSRG